MIRNIAKISCFSKKFERKVYKKSKRYVIVNKQNHVQNMECNINWVQKEKAR